MRVISTLETRRSVVGVTGNEPETKSAKPVKAFSMQSAAPCAETPSPLPFKRSGGKSINVILAVGQTTE